MTEEYNTQANTKIDENLKSPVRPAEIKVGMRPELSSVELQSVKSEGKPSRLQFLKEHKNIAALLGGVLMLVILLLVVVMATKSPKKKVANIVASNNSSASKVPENNNSAGYTQSAPADFQDFSLDLSSDPPQFIATKQFDSKIGEQVTWDDGFTILVTGVDKDYRQSSEFSYKNVAESGDEIIRVNMLIGNSTDNIMPIGYQDLALYLQAADGQKLDAERIPEDVYSPTDGQTLGGRQFRKISLHYRVKRGTTGSLIKTKSYTQSKATKQNGAERNPTQSLSINLGV